MALPIGLSELVSTLIKIFCGILVFATSGFFWRKRFQMRPLVPLVCNWSLVIPRLVVSVALSICICSLWVFLSVRFESLRVTGWKTTVLNTENIAEMMIGIWIFHAFAEEIFFRGFLFERIKAYMGLPQAVVLSSAFFAAAHLQNFACSAFLFLCSLFITAAYVKYGSLLYAVVVHAGINIFGYYMVLMREHLNRTIVVSAFAVAAVIVVTAHFMQREDKAGSTT
jgi:membrane protease YdiL (CAAX protease family)